MQVLRLVIVAVLAVCAASGCRTAGVGDLARPDPQLAPGTANVAALVAEHNRNAERIEVMQARPDLTVTVDEKGGRPSSHPLNGRMAMEQPRNFKLELYHSASGMTVGDIGSNDTEYWFWVKDKTQKAIYYCNYDEAESSRQAATFQPDWIKEAMGLRVISEAEASEITLKPGDPGTLVLTHRPHKAGGMTYTRVTIIDKATHKILEHQLRSADQKAVLAWAKVPEGYVEATDFSESGGGKTVLVPRRLQLRWVQEGLTLDVTFRDVQINNPIKQSQREKLFIEPTLGRSYSRINLAERIPGSASPTTIRETRPAPPSRVRLREPAPIEGDEADRDERAGSPIALNGAEPMTSQLSEAVVGPRYPTPPEPDFLRSESPGWKTATGGSPLP